MNWRLRKDQKAIFGPVDTSELQRWATEGRVLPNDEVSLNEGPWKPAVELADLELNWVLTPNHVAATLGPLHLLAYADLLQRKLLNGSERIIHHETREEGAVAPLVARELERRIAALTHQLNARPSTAPQQPDRMDAAGHEKIAQDMARRHEGLLSRVREQDIELASLKKELDAVHEAAIKQISEAKAAQKKAEQEAEEHKTAVTELRATHKDLTKNLRDLNERYILLRNQAGDSGQAPGGKPKVRLA